MSTMLESDYIDVTTPPRKAKGAASADLSFSINAPRYLKYSFCIQWIMAGALLLLTSPVIVVLMALIGATSPGPTIYRQRRVGRNRRIFTVFKLRTMYVNAEEKTGPVWSTPGDPRITKVGRVLRFLHLDELPQLWNVVRGEMALIGPRPERPEFTTHLADEIPGYLDRLAVRPGISGLAQVNLAPDTDLFSVTRKLELDLKYIRSASLALDARIACATLLKCIGIRRVIECSAADDAERTPVPIDGLSSAAFLRTRPR